MGNTSVFISLSIISVFLCTSVFGQYRSPRQIVGGMRVNHEDHSQIVASAVGLTNSDLNLSGRTFCSGVVVGSRSVLTAAHCVDGSNNKIEEQIFVVFGNVDQLGSGKRPRESIKVRTAFIHHKYAPEDGQRSRASNDLAILYLEKEISNRFSVAKMIRQNQRIGSNAEIILAGFGVTGGITSSDSGVLRAVNVTTRVENANRKMIVLKGPKLHGARIEEYPAGGYVYRSSAGGSCHGDSGGPSYLLHGDELILLGIITAGDVQRVARDPYGPSYCVGSSYIIDLRHYASYLLNSVKNIEEAPFNHPKGFYGEF